MASQDITLVANAADTISSARWSPAANQLAVGSWDGMVRVYDVATSGSAAPVASLAANGPVFSCDWNKDGTVIAVTGADKQVRLWQASTGQAAVIGAHDAPVRSVCFVDVPDAATPIIATGSWDKTVRYWDPRRPGTPLATLHCADRVYSMDTAGSLLVVATAERHIHLVDLHANPAAFARTVQSPLKHQTRAVAAFRDGKGWGTAGIEGRCALSAVSEQDARSIDFTFRCHRDQPDSNRVVKVWAVNDVRFHPTHPTTFSTAGSDGTYSFWDSNAHQRLKAPTGSAGGAITATDFNRDGTLFAYAVGYDWSMGYAKNTPNYPTKLMLHRIKEEEVRPRRR
ncbi:hypothetical protein LLEC1_07767 [Akanthomyces lecanii]|uniref:Uncharacterized protein n=1 Tax=Cordyceps confragosa TaxID=2714763 RepID=A0A179IGZ5_CORDF|nr:hypothetical protein LLEC1_07767 [Akanthomyces lecanii]